MLIVALVAALGSVIAILGCVVYAIAHTTPRTTHTYTQRIDVSNVDLLNADLDARERVQKLHNTLCEAQEAAERRLSELRAFCAAPTLEMEPIRLLPVPEAEAEAEAEAVVIYNDVAWGDLNHPGAVVVDIGRRLTEPSTDIKSAAPSVFIDAGVRCHNGATYKPRR